MFDCRLNQSPEPELNLHACCASKAWVQTMLGHLPVQDKEQFLKVAEKAWFSLAESDWLQAFQGHPKIGESALQAKFGNGAKFSNREQAQLEHVSAELIRELAELNQRYLERFGFIFIVCATGKSAYEMLDLLKLRMVNSRSQEILNAAREQHKITVLRLENFL